MAYKSRISYGPRFFSLHVFFSFKITNEHMVHDNVLNYLNCMLIIEKYWYFVKKNVAM